MLHMPCPMLLNAGGKTYADFVTHITAKATNGVKNWFDNPAAGSWRVTVGNFGPDFMDGSSWLSFMRAPGTRIFSAVAHGLPTSAANTSQRAAERQVFLVFARDIDRSSFYGLVRNGVQSESYDDGSGYPTFTCTELIYWDGASAWRMQPSLGSGPTPYDW